MRSAAITQQWHTETSAGSCPTWHIPAWAADDGGGQGTPVKHGLRTLFTPSHPGNSACWAFICWAIQHCHPGKAGDDNDLLWITPWELSQSHPLPWDGLDQSYRMSWIPTLGCSGAGLQAEKILGWPKIILCPKNGRTVPLSSEPGKQGSLQLHKKVEFVITKAMQVCYYQAMHQSGSQVLW